ncbi:hypothetical protein HETIRDRAFT_451386 [Heterobasidion irregulare TC 32-1]|uniref:Uncharacterized protein n=1 Tax=Heterobasidion irregulare (strain TC 32-1) TaxID=747525 RepID=W4K987_HETIT|nr:uncharacterized protein HETIRDRAFT_451386 [Heterobasidion irregulare TC 32-1]ETW81646.1 hypothetical protein HETIRDRAFT_451386 [Heterobasidion irregulare TC 32-1]
MAHRSTAAEGATGSGPNEQAPPILSRSCFVPARPMFCLASDPPIAPNFPAATRLVRHSALDPPSSPPSQPASPRLSSSQSAAVSSRVTLHLLVLRPPPSSHDPSPQPPPTLQILLPSHPITSHTRRHPSYIFHSARTRLASPGKTHSFFPRLISATPRLPCACCHLPLSPSASPAPPHLPPRPRPSPPPLICLRPSPPPSSPSVSSPDSPTAHSDDSPSSVAASFLSLCPSFYRSSVHASRQFGHPPITQSVLLAYVLGSPSQASAAIFALSRDRVWTYGDSKARLLIPASKSAPAEHRLWRARPAIPLLYLDASAVPPTHPHRLWVARLIIYSPRQQRPAASRGGGTCPSQPVPPPPQVPHCQQQHHDLDVHTATVASLPASASLHTRCEREQDRTHAIPHPHHYCALPLPRIHGSSVAYGDTRVHSFPLIPHTAGTHQPLRTCPARCRAPPTALPAHHVAASNAPRFGDPRPAQTTNVIARRGGLFTDASQRQAVASTDARSARRRPTFEAQSRSFIRSLAPLREQARF